MRGVGAFGLGLAAGGLAAYDSYRSRKRTENSILKALGKTSQAKEPTFKDFWDQSPIGKKVSGTQAPATVSTAKPTPVPQDAAPTQVAEEKPDPGTPMGEPMPQEAEAPAAQVASYDQDMWAEAPSSDDNMLP